MNWRAELTNEELDLATVFRAISQEDAAANIKWFPDTKTVVRLVGRLCELLDAYEQATSTRN